LRCGVDVIVGIFIVNFAFIDILITAIIIRIIVVKKLVIGVFRTIIAEAVLPTKIALARIN
jgi:hypothetical protein